MLSAKSQRIFRKWLKNVRYEQTEDGQIPIIVPMPPGTMRSFEGINSSAGWSDVIVILPWVLYNYYGDIQILKENYGAMEKWISYIHQTAYTENPEELSHLTGERAEHLKYIWNTNFHFGDWLTPSVSINKDTGAVDLMQSAYMTMDIVPTFFYAYSCKLMTQISKTLGYIEKQNYYQNLFVRIKEAFQYEYLNDDLTIKSDLQGIQVLALHTGLVEGDAKRKTVEKLVRLIHENNNLLDTGFLSVPYLLDVLTENGERELAYKILYNEDCPSWLYEVKMGATSIWESWQALLPDGNCGYVSMAHYAFGCVGNWIYQNIAGIRSLKPGYKQIEIRPDFHCGLTSASGYHDSIYGRISCSWEWKEENIDIYVEVPFNTTAHICLGRQEKFVEAGNYHFHVKKEEL